MWLVARGLRRLLLVEARVVMAVVERAILGQEVVEEMAEIEAQAGAVLLMVKLAVKVEQPSGLALVPLIAAKEYATVGLKPSQMG